MRASLYLIPTLFLFFSLSGRAVAQPAGQAEIAICQTIINAINGIPSNIGVPKAQTQYLTWAKNMLTEKIIEINGGGVSKADFGRFMRNNFANKLFNTLGRIALLDSGSSWSQLIKAGLKKLHPFTRGIKIDF